MMKSLKKIKYLQDTKTEVEGMNYILIKFKNPFEKFNRETPKTTWNNEFYVLGTKAYSIVCFVIKESKFYLKGKTKTTKKEEWILRTFLYVFFGRREYTAKRDKTKIGK